MPVREMAAVRQAQAHDGVADIERGHVHREVGGAAGMRLHVGMFGAE